MNVPFKLARRVARRSVPQGRGGARHGAAQGPPRGRRHARVDLQRDADRGRARRSSTTCRTSSARTAEQRRIAMSDSYRDPDAQPDLERTGCTAFPSARYTVGKAIEQPDAIIVRSHDMHAMAIPASVKAIGRAGAGTNNIPVAEMSKRGVPVFNAPGANANAVKELVLAALLMAARNVVPALRYVDALDPTRAGPRAARRGRQEAVRRRRAAAAHARHHRPGRDRQPGRRHGDQARHEGRSASTRRSPSTRRGACRRACAARTASTRC